MWLCGVVIGQTTSAPLPVRKPLTIVTAPKALAAKWISQDGKEVELSGQLVFTVTKANADDTLTGTMIYLLPDNVREKLAKQLERPLSTLPPSVMQANVATTWAKSASCPYLRVESGELAFEMLSGKIHCNRTTLEFLETQDYLPQLFCHWTRQLNARRHRRAIIAAINRALTGGEPE